MHNNQGTSSKIIGLSFHPVQKYQIHGDTDSFRPTKSVFGIVTRDPNGVVDGSSRSRVEWSKLFPPFPELLDQTLVNVEPLVLPQPVQQFMGKDNWDPHSAFLIWFSSIFARYLHHPRFLTGQSAHR